MKRTAISIGKFIIPVLVFAMLYSCKDEAQPTDNDGNDTTAVNDVVTDDLTDYKFPSPVEVYIFLWEDDVKFDGTLMNSTDKIGAYVTTDKKALNFGIYSSDLAYCTVNGKNQETFNYFTTAKQLADEMGLMEGFDEDMVKRIDQNIGNADSLYKFSTESYSLAINYLESIEQDNLLPYIVTGGWIESLYIAVNSIKKYSPENSTVMRVAEQQLVLDNLVEYMKSLEGDAQLNAILEKLLDIQSSYDKLYDNVDVIITEGQFKEIAQKVNAFRNEITK
ncbi:MAG: hypothetical protein ABIJ16_07370 [Bacteroidota bacterium]